MTQQGDESGCDISSTYTCREALADGVQWDISGIAGEAGIRYPVFITQLSYPEADIRHQQFEEARIADGFYDVAISNIPFWRLQAVRSKTQELVLCHSRLFLRQDAGQGETRRT